LNPYALLLQLDQPAQQTAELTGQQVDLQTAIALAVEALDAQALASRAAGHHTLQSCRLDTALRAALQRAHLWYLLLQVGMQCTLLLEKMASLLQIAADRLPGQQIKQHQQQKSTQQNECQAVARRHRLPALRQWMASHPCLQLQNRVIHPLPP